MRTTHSKPAAQRSGIIAAVLTLLAVEAAQAAAAWAPVYSTDFTTDPGWTTSHPGDYYWNSGSGTYTLTMADASGSYATTPIALTPDRSFKLEFDLRISRMDYAGDICVGLFGLTRDAYPETGPHPYLKFNFGSGSLGHGIQLAGFDGSDDYHKAEQYPSPYETNTWYYAAATYDHDAGTLDAVVRRKSDNTVIWSSSVGGVGGFANLVYLGASKVGDDYEPGATGMATIDNVCLYELAAGEPALTASLSVSPVEICWSSQTNTVYDVEYCSNLTSNGWVKLHTNVIGQAERTCVQDVSAVGQSQRYYRVVQVTN